MNNIDQLKKKIIYRSEYRGIKEMDLLLSSFVKKYINVFNMDELKQLDNLLNIDDDSLLKWYLNRQYKMKIPVNKVSILLKKFKLK
jgi:antitoxin CptB|tara:strand:- start:677 stop:934 length:258 start_codon:yes stop_codon:yes gene_type:complete